MDLNFLQGNSSNIHGLLNLGGNIDKNIFGFESNNQFQKLLFHLLDKHISTNQPFNFNVNSASSVKNKKKDISNNLIQFGNTQISNFATSQKIHHSSDNKNIESNNNNWKEVIKKFENELKVSILKYGQSLSTKNLNIEDDLNIDENFETTKEQWIGLPLSDESAIKLHEQNHLFSEQNSDLLKSEDENLEKKNLTAIVWIPSSMLNNLYFKQNSSIVYDNKIRSQENQNSKNESGLWIQLIDNEKLNLTQSNLTDQNNTNKTTFVSEATKPELVSKGSNENISFFNFGSNFSPEQNKFIHIPKNVISLSNLLELELNSISLISGNNLKNLAQTKNESNTPLTSTNSDQKVVKINTKQLINQVLKFPLSIEPQPAGLSQVTFNLEKSENQQTGSSYATQPEVGEYLTLQKDVLDNLLVENNFSINRSEKVTSEPPKVGDTSNHQQQKTDLPKKFSNVTNPLRQINSQINETNQSTVKNIKPLFSFKLQPEVLGQVTYSLEQIGNQQTATIHVSHPKLSEFLGEQKENLQKLLVEKNIPINKVEILTTSQPETLENISKIHPQNTDSLQGLKAPTNQIPQTVQTNEEVQPLDKYLNTSSFFKKGLQISEEFKSVQNKQTLSAANFNNSTKENIIRQIFNQLSEITQYSYKMENVTKLSTNKPENLGQIYVTSNKNSDTYNLTLPKDIRQISDSDQKFFKQNPEGNTTKVNNIEFKNFQFTQNENSNNFGQEFKTNFFSVDHISGIEPNFKVENLKLPDLMNFTKDIVQKDIPIKQITDQIVQSCKLQYSADKTQIQVQLKPEYLGFVKIVIQNTGEEIKGILYADRPEVRQNLEANLPALQKSFQEQNIKMDRLEVQDYSTHLANQNNSSDLKEWHNAPNEQVKNFNNKLNPEWDEISLENLENKSDIRDFGYNTLELVA